MDSKDKDKMINILDSWSQGKSVSGKIKPRINVTKSILSRMNPEDIQEFISTGELPEVIKLSQSELATLSGGRLPSLSCLRKAFSVLNEAITYIKNNPNIDEISVFVRGVMGSELDATFK